MRRAATIVIATALVSVLAVAAAWFGLSERAAATAPRPVWTEVTWPFPIDQWGKGKAFRCKATDCGTEVTVYLRAKLGFCDCTAGVANDDDLDRMGDLELIGRASPLGAGRPVSIGGMKGRSRASKLNSGTASGNTVISIAFNERCDMIAATALLSNDRPAVVEPIVIEFLHSNTVMRWAEIALGL